MDILSLIGLVFLALITTVIGFVAGYYFGKSKANIPVDVSSQVNALNALNSQLAEIKTKFQEVEKSRIEIEKEREKMVQTREKHFEEMQKNTLKWFEDQRKASDQTAEEREKRLQEMQKGTLKWFEEQKKTTEENDKKRTEQIQGISGMMGQFQRMLFGTSTRGKAGEEILKKYLKQAIQAGNVKTDVRIGDGVVEFAWDLKDGKFIPIDSKVPDIMDIIDQLEQTKDGSEQKKFKSDIKSRVGKHIEEIKKYQNQARSTDICILSVPDAVIDAAPELIDVAARQRVYLTGYSYTYLIAYLLAEDYAHRKDEGDLGTYRTLVGKLITLVDNIQKKTETIERGLRMIEKANEQISEETKKAKRME